LVAAVAVELGWLELEGAMRPLRVAVVDGDARHPLEVAAVGDQQPVQAFAADGSDEALGDGVGEHRQLRLKGMVSSELFG
jgi:hypothetical protein